MKTILILLTILLLSYLAKAEYGGHHIKIEIETTSGEIKTGFVYVASTNLKSDSLKNTKFLTKALDQGWQEWDKKDSFFYFKDRVKYLYREFGNSDEGKQSIYALSNKQAILLQKIRSIKIVEMIYHTYMRRISSPLSLSDTSWSNKENLSSYSFGGYLCYHQIFVHKNSKRIDKIIRKLEARQKELKDVELNYDNGDEIDKELSEIVTELHGEKAVIITECSC